MLKETSWASAVTAGPRRKPSGHGLEHLEFAAELFLDADFSLAFLKLRARLSSLLKLLTLLRLGLARCGLSSGELAGSGERQPRGEGDLDTWRLLRSRRSKGEGDLDTAGGGEGRELGNAPVLQPDVGGGLFAARAAVLVLVHAVLLVTHPVLGLPGRSEGGAGR